MNTENPVHAFIYLFQTANALSFVLYNLARNRESQAALIREIDEVIPRGSLLTAEVIDKMPYLKACVKESFR